MRYETFLKLAIAILAFPPFNPQVAGVRFVSTEDAENAMRIEELGWQAEEALEMCTGEMALLQRR